MKFIATKEDGLPMYEHGVVKFDELLPVADYGPENPFWYKFEPIILEIKKCIEEEGLRYPLMVYQMPAPYGEYKEWEEVKNYHNPVDSPPIHNTISKIEKRTNAPGYLSEFKGLIKPEDCSLWVGCGCQRWHALKYLGCTEVSVIYVPIEVGGVYHNSRILDILNCNCDSNNGEWFWPCPRYYAPKGIPHTLEWIKEWHGKS